mgnify:CR=1 FL=1
MSTTTLSQRLRDLRHGIFPDIETVNAVLDDCIAQAEAQEAQAGELSDEEVGRAAMDSIPADSHVGLALDQDGAIDMARAFFERGLRYARDHGYLKPSQAIGEQTPVAWRNVRRIDLRIPVRLHNALASLAMDTIGAIVDHLGVKVNDDWDGTYWRLRTALMKMRGVGRSSAIEGASAIMEAMDRPSPITPEARDRAIEALDQSLVVWNDGDDKLVRMYIRQALSALRGS